MPPPLCAYNQHPERICLGDIDCHEKWINTNISRLTPPCGVIVPLLQYASLRGFPHVLLDLALLPLSCLLPRDLPRGSV